MPISIRSVLAICRWFLRTLQFLWSAFWLARVQPQRFRPFFSLVTYIKYAILFFPSWRSSPRGVIRVTRLLTLRHGAVVFLLFPFPLSLSACPRPLFGRGVAITPVVLFRFPNTVSFAPPLPSRWRCSGA